MLIDGSGRRLLHFWKRMVWIFVELFVYVLQRNCVCVLRFTMLWSEAETESRQNFVSVKSDIPDFMINRFELFLE